jgi:hypothetical protein
MWMLRRVALVRTDVSEELSASLIRVTRIGELRTTLAVTSNRRSVHNIPEDAILQDPERITEQDIGPSTPGICCSVSNKF